jgi:RNA polymerase sigma factor (TIGR02999 family)
MSLTSPATPIGTDPDTDELLVLLQQWGAGSQQALEELTPLVYEKLRRLAQHYMRRERRGHTLQPTAIVHEAFVRLRSMEVNIQNKKHFFALAARLMRRILVDHAKQRKRDKRQMPEFTPLEGEVIETSSGDIDVIEIDEALEKLARRDERLAQVLELHYFGGLTYEELAATLQMSEATVHRDLRLAKAWMLKNIGDPRSDSTKR